MRIFVWDIIRVAHK